MVDHLDDRIINKILSDKELLWYVACIISMITKIKYDRVYHNLVLVNPNANRNLNLKEKELDNFLINDNYMFDFEVNRFLSSTVRRKNKGYLCELYNSQYARGSNYQKKDKTIIQINLNSCNSTSNDAYLDKINMSNVRNRKVYDDKLFIYDINMTLIKNMEYNKIRKDKQIVYLYVLVCDKSYYDDILKDYPELEMVVNKLEDLLDENVFRMHWDSEKMNLYCAREEGLEQGIEQGIEQGKIEEKNDMIKNMLKHNVSIDNIILYTGATRDKINEIKQMIFN